MRLPSRPQLFRSALLAVSVAVGAVLAFGLYRDTNELSQIGASVAHQERLDGKLLHSVGSVVEQLAFRTRIQAGVLCGMFGLVMIFAVRGRATAP